MAVRVPGQRSVRWRLSGIGEGAWVGGLNLRDSYLEVAPNELVDGTNLTLDERGVAIKRNDCPASADFPAPPGAVTAFFWSTVLQLAIIQSGTTLYKCAIGGGAWTSFRTTGSAAVASFCDFAGKVVYCHPADGTRTYDGTTDAVADATITGVAIATWQTKVWVARPNSTQVNFSALGAVTFAAADFQNFKEKDDKPLTALFGGSGLLVFKEDSTYRVNDPTSAAFQTIDWTTGCVGARAVIGQDGLIFVWGIDGLYEGNGFGRFANIGDKVHPRFFSSNVNATTKPLISAVSYNGRVYFAFPRTSATIPDGLLELNPRVGWLMESSLGGAQIGPLTKYLAANGQTRAIFASGSATIKELLTGTTRTGFSCSLLTGFQQPFGGYLANIMRLGVSLNLPGTTPPAIKLNYLNMGSIPATWGPFVDTIAAAGAQQASVMPRIRGRAFQLSIDDAAVPLSSLSVFDAQMDTLLVGLN